MQWNLRPVIFGVEKAILRALLGTLLRRHVAARISWCASWFGEGFFGARLRGQTQRAPYPPEFAQPRLSRVKRRSSPARGYKFGCVCSYMAGHYPGILMTFHIGTNTPKFVPPRWGRLQFDPTQTGLCKFGWVWSSLTNLKGQTEPKRRFSLIFADFCRFSPFPRKQSIWETQLFTENPYFWCPQVALWGEDEVDTLGSAEWP